MNTRDHEQEQNFQEKEGNMNLHWSVFLTILTKFCAVCDGVQQRFIEEPRSVSVKEGQNVTLSCSVDNKMGVLQWTKGGVHVSSDK